MCKNVTLKLERKSDFSFQAPDSLLPPEDEARRTKEEDLAREDPSFVRMFFSPQLLRLEERPTLVTWQRLYGWIRSLEVHRPPTPPQHF